MTQKVLRIKIKKLSEDAIIPTYARNGDAGMDLVGISRQYKKNQIIYDTGIAIEIPHGYAGLLFPRSSISKKELFLANSIGLVDSGYRDSIKLVFNTKRPIIGPHDADVHAYAIGDRIAQLVIIPFPLVVFEEVAELSDSERGTGSFGSTNV